MKHRLVLVRHAQATEHHPRGDHERVLTEQGTADATELGVWLAQEGLAPDHVLVSTAERAQQTLAALRRGLAPDALATEQIWHERRVYDGGTDGVLAAVGEVPHGTQVLWVVGHEPVMSTTAWELTAGQASDGSLDHQLTRGFPTATAVVLAMEGEWAVAQPGTARLGALHTARV